MNSEMNKHTVKLVLWIGLTLVVSWGKSYAITPIDSLNLARKNTSIPLASGQRYFIQLTPQISSSEVHDPIIIPEVALADSIQEKRARAHSLRDQVEKAQRFRETLDAFTILDLPMGVSTSGGLVDYSIVIDKVTLSPRGSILDAYMSFTVPQTGDRIAFGGKIPLTKDGGIAGVAKIFLLGDHSIKMNDKTIITLKGSYNSKTFVELDCNGFKAMSLEAEIEFSRDQLLPEDAKGTIAKEGRVKVNFLAYVQDWNELLVKISVPPFRVNGLDDIGFSIHDAYLDWSDLTNPAGLAFPANYQSAYGQTNLWRGFFMKRADVRLPKKFQEGQDSSRTVLGVENLIIDDTGFSGIAFGEYLIKDGSMSGWSYSLDRLRVGVVSNQVEEFDLMGKISMPAFEQEGKPVRMGYRAARGADGNYIFSVTIQDQVKLPLWGADVILNPGSGVIVREKNNKFYPTATLNGMMSISALSKGPKAEFAGIRFEQLIISTESPHFRPGTFGFGSGDSNAKASGFPLVVRNIGIKSVKDEVGLSFDVTVNIGGKPTEEGFSGTAGLIVWGNMGTPSPQPSGEVQAASSSNSKWKFERVELTAIGINIRKPGVFELDGMVRFFENDPTYGDGFKGTIKAKFQKIDGKAGVEALFGKTATYRYWFADALVEFKDGLWLAPGFYAYGFGGGFYSKMKQSDKPVPGIIGLSASGISYLPDENSMGLKAFMGFGARPKTSFNGDVTLAIAMNRSGGINTVSLIGNANFLTPEFNIGTELIKAGAEGVAKGVQKVLDKLSPASQVYGSVNLLFDNVNDVFHGNIEVYVNVVGGIVKGVGAGNKAGWAVVHFSKEEWYILIGTPEQPIGLEVARLFKAKSYFMMGKNLPGSPPPPAKVSEILGGVNLDYMRDMNALQSGLGFAFGMNLIVDTGDLRFLMFYGRFAAGAGFDIMLKNYGTSYHCEGSSGPMGINGWYANGQAYAFVQGKVGIKVNLKFYKGDYDILSIGAAAVLQAKGPNPFWMKGIVGGQYRILGGLVKGNCRFEVTVGKDCKPVGENNPLGDVSIIAEVSPAKGSGDIDVFNAPQAAFNIPVGEVFNITDVDNNTRVFRARLAEFSIKDGSTSLEGTLKWNASNDVVVMDSRDILPPKKDLKVVVKVVFEERLMRVWLPVQFQGKPVEEIVETNFTTGEAPDFIPPSNVEVSYPLAGQYNFYPREYGQGFIKLKKGQPYLFNPGPEWIQKARMTQAQARQQYKEFDFAYNEGTKTVNYTLPDGLSLATVYNFELLNMPRQSRVIDANITKVSSELVGEEAGTAQLTTKEIEGKLDLLEVKGIYASEFRTSKYQTFVEKARSVTVAFTNREYVNPQYNIYMLEGGLRGNEFFDKAEISGTGNNEKLIHMEADLSNNTWYNSLVYPLVYEGYPIMNKFFISSETIAKGLPPLRELQFSQCGENLVLENGNPNPAENYAFAYAYIEYNIMHSMVMGYQDIRLGIANYIADRPYLLTPQLARYLDKPFPVLVPGTYAVSLSYVIPGIKLKTSEYGWSLVYK
jgi:hypothetical protein